MLDSPKVLWSMTTVSTVDDFQAFVICENDPADFVRCPICGSDAFTPQPGCSSIVPVVGPLHLVMLFDCETCRKEVVAVHRDLHDALRPGEDSDAVQKCRT